MTKKQQALDFLRKKYEVYSRESFELDEIDREKQIDDERKQRMAKESLLQKEQQGIIKMRRQWSEWILWCIVVIVVFDVFLISAIGLDVFEFDRYLVPAFVTESLIKVIGLALIIVKFLFGKDSMGKKR